MDFLGKFLKEPKNPYKRFFASILLFLGKNGLNLDF